MSKEINQIYYEGEVGIGTPNPQAKLHVLGTEQVLIESKGGEADIRYKTPNQNWQTGANNHGFYIYENGYRLVVKKEDGHVGVGTTTPTHKLTIQDGNIQLRPKHVQGKKATWEQGLIFTDEAIRDGAKICAKREKWSGAPMGLSFYTGGYTNLKERMTIKSDGDVYLTGTLHQKSDIKFKKEIGTIDNALNKINQLRGVTYKWKEGNREKGAQIGLIAQEVEQVFPEVVVTDDAGHKSVAYSKMIAPLIEAINELKKNKDEQIEKLEAALKKQGELIELLQKNY